MYIAQAKRKENIAEYILYLWQLEDLLRALHFSPEAIDAQLAQPASKDMESRNTLLVWYMGIVNLLKEEGKTQSGHLSHTLHLIADLQDLHDRLMQLPAGKRYRELFARLAPELPRLRVAIGKDDISDMELCFRALYAAMLYRMKGDSERENTVNDVIELISPAIAELARIYRGAERGEIDLGDEEEVE